MLNNPWLQTAIKIQYRSNGKVINHREMGAAVLRLKNGLRPKVTFGYQLASGLWSYVIKSKRSGKTYIGSLHQEPDGSVYSTCNCPQGKLTKLCHHVPAMIAVHTMTVNHFRAVRNQQKVA